MRYRNGQIAELAVQAHFIKLGYEVFNNVCAHGPIDLVVVDLETGTSTFIDVKSVATLTYNKDGSVSPAFGNRLGLKDGVWNIGYIHETDEVIYPEGFSVHPSNNA